MPANEATDGDTDGTADGDTHSDTVSGTVGPREQDRARRLRRAGLGGGAIGGLLAGVYMLVEGFSTGFAWWVAAPSAVLGVVAGTVAGARTGREDRAHKDSLEPNETVLNAYPVWPAPAPAWSGRRGGEQAAPLQLRTTTRHLQLWEGTTLVWAHGLGAVRWEADGSVLRVLHGGAEIARLEGPGSNPELPLDFCQVADRIAARFGRRPDSSP
ncbi:hypothetical protein [Streptomyces sp. NPDC003943]